MSTQNISSRVTALSDSLKTTFQLISRLAKLTFQPGSTPLEGDGDVRVELSQDIQDSLRQHDETLEILKQEVEDFTTLRGTSRRKDIERDLERTQLAAQIARLGEDLKHARSQFRRAQLTAKRASEAAKQKERELLFTTIQQGSEDTSGRSTPDLFAGRRQHQNKQLTADELLVNASSDVTAALRRTHDLLASELSRSRFAQETLDQSTAELNELGERYSNLGTLLDNSKGLIRTLVKSQKSDTWYLETALYILIVTICWLFFRRLLYGPLWWFLWLPTKYFVLSPFRFFWNLLVIKPFSFIFGAFGIIGRSAASTTSQPALRQTTTSRPPLRVKPSATGGIPRFAPGHDPRNGPAIPAGGGGAGAKIGPEGERVDPSTAGSLSQKIGQMAEASRQQAQQVPNEQTSQPVQEPKANEQPQQGGGEPKVAQPIVRGDGTVLQERGDRPVNPKKKVFDDDAKPKFSKRDEL